MRLEGDKNKRGRNLPRPCAHVCRDTAKNERIKFHGVSKSSVIFHERHGNLKFKYGNRSFWCRGYYVDTVGKNAKRIAEYIQNQLKEGQISDQMTLREMKDLFTGSK